MNRLIDEARIQASLKPDLYAQVDRHFVNSYFAMLLVNGLTADLVNIIASNDIFIEDDAESNLLVLHIGSIKLRVQDHRTIGIVTSMHDERSDGKFHSALMITIWHSNTDRPLIAEFVMVAPFGGTHEFTISLPTTMKHPLATMLEELKRVVSFDRKTVISNLKSWATRRKQ